MADDNTKSKLLELPYEEPLRLARPLIESLDERGRLEKETSTRRRNGVRECGLKTLQQAFRIPILAILRSCGGKAKRLAVLGLLEDLLASDLTPYDRGLIPSGGATRWQKSAEWEVRALREDGLLEPVGVSESGVWQLTPQGRQIAEGRHRQYRDFRAWIAQRDDVR